MMAVISPKTYLTAPLRLKLIDGTRLNDVNARVSRSATLDGGCVITHHGLTRADRTLKLCVRMSDAEYDSLVDMMSADTAFTISCHAGFFSGVIENVSEKESCWQIDFLCDGN